VNRRRRPTDLPPKNAILFDQIGERLPLPAIEPTGDSQEQQSKHRQVDHEREVISRSHQNGRNPVDHEVGQYGIENDAGTVQLSDSTLDNNQASAGDGGGIRNNIGGTTEIERVTISNNTASGNGGGIENFFGSVCCPSLSIQSSR
jgi:hypothetical protein